MATHRGEVFPLHIGDTWRAAPEGGRPEELPLSGAAWRPPETPGRLEKASGSTWLVLGARARVLLCERYDKRIAFKAWLELLEEL